MTDLVRGERTGITRPERGLRIAAGLLALISVGFAVGYGFSGVFLRSEFPYAANSVAKDLLLAGLSLLIVADVRRWSAVAVPLIVVAHVVMPMTLLGNLVFGQSHSTDHTALVSDALTPVVRWAWIAADVVVVALFLRLHWLAIRARYDIRYLSPSAFRGLMAMAEVLVLRHDPDVAPAEVAGRVDRYLASFRAHGKRRIGLALLAVDYAPLLNFRPQLHLMSADVRERWLRKHFLDEIAERRGLRVLRPYRQGIIRAAQQFCFMGYYGDARGASKAGYVPFSQRPESAPAVRGPRKPGLQCLDAATDIPGEDLDAGIVIVGTGAGGAMLAYSLAAMGRDVLLLERGMHVDPAQFTEDEAVQLSNLYADGALTLSQHFDFQVAQGMCVGGSTVVNNAVCFDLPEHVLERWLAPPLAAGLEPDRVHAAFASVRELLEVRPLGPAAIRNPGAEHLVGAIEALPSSNGYEKFKLVDANIVDCLGSGYCNIGCQWGRKLSALDWTLPLAQQTLPGEVRILPECRVIKVLMNGGRATALEAELGEGGRRLTVHADKIVLSAGAIASSIILQRSGLGDGKAGRGLSFNMGSPVTLDFDAVLHSERGAQMSHYLEPQDPGDDGLALETWWNPIVTQSLYMPGWFDAHWANMRRYRNMTCLGVVVGTKSNGTVSASRRGYDVKLDYTPCDADIVKLKQGIALASEIGLRAGARRAMPSTFRLMEVRSPADLEQIAQIGGDGDVNLGSSHPQGGNPMSEDAKTGVVDPGFRVYGTENVFVCDASVFPSSITVNPQLTVMALAAYAAEHIA